jgi:hypothetical protein
LYDTKPTFNAEAEEEYGGVDDGGDDLWVLDLISCEAFLAEKDNESSIFDERRINAKVNRSNFIAKESNNNASTIQLLKVVNRCPLS